MMLCLCGSFHGMTFTTPMNSGEGTVQSEHKGNQCGLDQTGTQLPLARQEAQVHSEAGSRTLEF